MSLSLTVIGQFPLRGGQSCSCWLELQAQQALVRVWGGLMSYHNLSFISRDCPVDAAEVSKVHA
jgi:hypothetical protein